MSVDMQGRIWSTIGVMHLVRRMREDAKDEHPKHAALIERMADEAEEAVWKTVDQSFDVPTLAAFANVTEADVEHWMMLGLLPTLGAPGEPRTNARPLLERALAHMDDVGMDFSDERQKADRADNALLASIAGEPTLRLGELPFYMAEPVA